MTTDIHGRIVLASASPRRRELLEAAGIAFDIDPANVDERSFNGEAPKAYVLRLATEKAAQVAGRHPSRAVLGADTSVVVGTEVLGKPADAADARRMLKLLSGRTHAVLTGVAMQLDRRVAVGVSRTTVEFARLGDDEIAWYVETREPFGKAGAYAIQGLASRFIPAIVGSYANVVGLPVDLVLSLCREIGFTPDFSRPSAFASDPSDAVF